MENKLNKLLADLVVEYHKLQNFHWYVKGKDFFAAHAKLEEFYDYINEAVDEVAENILMVGGSPKASLKAYLELAEIKEADEDHKKVKDIYKDVLADFSYLLASVKDIKAAADEESNYLISSLMDEYIKQFSKSIWMVRQVVED